VTQFSELHDWCAAALQIEEGLVSTVDWSALMFAVADPDVPVNEPRIRRRLAAANMTGAATMMATDDLPHGKRPVTIVAFAATAEPLWLQTSRWRPAKLPAAGLVAVQRGWLARAGVTSDERGPEDASVFVPDEPPSWPHQAGDQSFEPVVLATAVSHDGRSAELIRRAATAARGLGRERQQQWMDPTHAGPLGSLNVHDNAMIMLQLAFGAQPLPQMLTPAAFAGRWWLAMCLEAISAATGGYVAMPDIPDVPASWSVVLADQRGRRRFGDIFTDAEAAAPLHGAVAASVAFERTPNQTMLLDALRDRLGDTFDELAREWARHPDLHETRPQEPD
jgi:hypothetical protein